MSLHGSIQEILSEVPGVFGVATHHPAKGKPILINEHEVFPAASVIKVPILVEILLQRDEGRVCLDERIPLRDRDKVDGSGVLKELSEGTELTLRDLATLMTVVSDNTATNMIIERIGTEAVTDRMRSLGLERTVLARKMYNFAQAALGKENTCTPYEMMRLLTWVAEGRISSKSTSDEIIGIMAKQQYRDKIPLLLPDDTRVANKTGSITGVTHDVGIVFAPGGSYVLCTMVKNIEDKLQAERAIAEVSKAAYEYFCSQVSGV